MIAYDYNPVTREYIGRETAQENPKHPGEYLIPAHSTLTEPPALREGYARVWNEEEWSYVEDHRGATIWRDHFTSRTVEELGAIPEGWSLIRPPEPVTRPWIIESVYQAKAAKAYGGITVNRSGIDYLFATDPESIALCNAVLISLGAGVQSVDWKVWHAGTPAVLTLNATEFRAIFAAGMAMVQESFAAESELNAEYAAMTDEQISAMTIEQVSAHIADRFARIHPAVEV